MLSHDALHNVVTHNYYNATYHNRGKQLTIQLTIDRRASCDFSYFLKKQTWSLVRHALSEADKFLSLS